MESKWGYHPTQKADADLDDAVGYIAVDLENPKTASDFKEASISLAMKRKDLCRRTFPSPAQAKFYSISLCPSSIS